MSYGVRVRVTKWSTLMSRKESGLTQGIFIPHISTVSHTEQKVWPKLYLILNKSNAQTLATAIQIKWNTDLKVYIPSDMKLV